MFGAILGAVLPALVGGLLDRDSADDQQDSAQDFSAERYALERGDFLADRKHSERQAAKLLRRDRNYYERLVKGDRRYTSRHNRKVLAESRRYMEGAQRQDRERFYRASDRMQRQSNRGAERTAASRGVDFQQLRDDAIAAGFNPLTAMSMAHAYSTETDYTNKREVWQGDTAYRVAGGGGSGGGGIGGAPMAPGAPSGGFMASGGGYQATFNPALSAGGFVREALERGIDTYWNTPAPVDPEAEAVMAQVQAGVQDQYLRSRQYRGDFGFDLTKVEPYRPAVAVTNPPLDRSNAPQAAGTDGVDVMHGRPVEETPVSDIPVTGVYDLGGGQKVRGLSQDVEWSEIAQMGNEAWLGYNALPKIDDYISKHFKPWVRSQFAWTEGTGTEVHAPPIQGRGWDYDEFPEFRGFGMP